MILTLSLNNRNYTQNPVSVSHIVCYSLKFYKLTLISHGSF